VCLLLKWKRVNGRKNERGRSLELGEKKERMLARKDERKVVGARASKHFGLQLHES
jgi:hypothetical protein